MTSEAKDVAETAEEGLANTRFSVFSSGYVALDENFFKELFGIEAGTQTHRKAQFSSEFSATREQTVYQLLVIGPKIDITISAALEFGEIPKALPVLQNGEEVRAQVRRAAGLLVEKVRETRRLAVGEQVLRSATSRLEAYKKLAKLLPSVAIDAEASSDLFYRINRPRVVELGGRKFMINRLSQWAAVQLHVTLTAAEISKTAICGEAVSVITDVNSQAEDDLSLLTVDDKGKVIDTLFAFSTEIAEKGDRP